MRSLAHPTIVKSSLIALLLATVLSMAAFAPAAHAAPNNAPVPKEPHQCVWNLINSNTDNLSNGDQLSDYLYAQYDTYSGAYCGYLYGATDIYVAPWQPGGKVTVDVYNWHTAKVIGTQSATANGGGPNGWLTPVQTATIYAPPPTCNLINGWFGNNSVGGQVRCN